MVNYTIEMIIGLFVITAAIFHPVNDLIDVLIPIILAGGAVKFIGAFFNWREIYHKNNYLITVNTALILILIYFYQSNAFSNIYLSGVNCLYLIALAFILISLMACYEFTGRMEKYHNVIEYNKLLKIDPTDVKIWNNRGIALEELSDFEGAVKSYEKAVEIDPSYVKAWYNGGNILSKMKRYQGAAEFYKRALEWDPENTKVWNNMGNNLISAKKYTESINSFDQVLKLDPNNFKATYNKGYALEMLDRYTGALECYNQVLELKPEDPESWYRKGVVLEELGEKHEASSCYDTALNLNPDFKDARHARNELQ
ncbi:tetratricopeptide repeat protein [Methanobacterium aggregans]|uniref:tetratricopeptide repeat protein n=1 Tax=Methanobacterium aggregans TaxID=1615586 RepID=UPI001AE24233|nr:tetratricopeptide repeat protein [Methanobacterium aggregans]MBP2046536.1 tetratricopeptide (TPR) repeat protein [Methanobacterium aggregans]